MSPLQKNSSTAERRRGITDNERRYTYAAVVPGKRKNKQVRAMHDSVAPGDLISTAGGILATVKERDGDTVTLLIDENTGTTMKVIIYAIQSIVEKSKT